MKRINRSAAPSSFTELITKHCPANWDEFVLDYQDVYREIRELLLRDQLMISGYTELPLELNGAIHIDHFRKKGLFGTKELFHWENFVVDERENMQYGAGYKDAHVSTKEIYNKIISPVLEIPEDYLTYMSDGSIIPLRSLTNTDMIDKAKTTISIFNLNHSFLKKKRCELIKIFQSYKCGGLSKNDVYEAMAQSGFFSVIDFVYDN